MQVFLRGALLYLSACTQEGMEPEVPAKGESVSIIAAISSDLTKVTLGESDGTSSYTFTKGEDLENGKTIFTYDGVSV